MLSALSLASKSGVDIRIVTPHRPDKWYVHTLTRSYYRDLIRAGVKIYEYERDCKCRFITKIIREILRIFAPLM